MSNRFDICTPRPKKDGGSYWVKIGSAWQGDKGIQLVFDALPIPDSEGRCVANLFEPRNRDDQHRANLSRGQQQNTSLRELDDEVPF
ncbi:hypothetical protein SXAG_00132 [Synechococcus phage S-CBS4]|nr:hypothetical protein SXAG_00132 [Synechococcus phage S-CBS4]